MFLLVFRDGTARRVADNLSTADLLASAQHLVSIFRFKSGRYQQLIRSNALEWIDVPPGKDALCPEGKVHL